MYSLVQSDLATIHENILPNVNQDFLDAKQRVDSFLDVKNFAKIAPVHYEYVRSKKWYFSLGILFNYDLNNAVSSQQDLMNTILECLDQTVPDSWKPRVNEKIEFLRACGEAELDYILSFGKAGLDYLLSFGEEGWNFLMSYYDNGKIICNLSIDIPI